MTLFLEERFLRGRDNFFRVAYEIQILNLILHLDSGFA